MLYNELLVNAFNTVTLQDDFYSEFCVVSTEVREDYLDTFCATFFSIISLDEFNIKASKLEKKYPFIVVEKEHDIWGDRNSQLPNCMYFEVYFNVDKISEHYDELLDYQSAKNIFMNEVNNRAGETSMSGVVAPNINYHCLEDSDSEEEMPYTGFMCLLSVNDNEELIREMMPRITVSAEFAAGSFINGLCGHIFDSAVGEFICNTPSTNLSIHTDFIEWNFSIPVNIMSQIMKEVKLYSEEDIYFNFFQINEYDDENIIFFNKRLSMKITPNVVSVNLKFAVNDKFIVDDVPFAEDDLNYPIWTIG